MKELGSRPEEKSIVTEIICVGIIELNSHFVILFSFTGVLSNAVQK
jgi:hypothetical protein